MVKRVPKLFEKRDSGDALGWVVQDHAAFLERVLRWQVRGVSVGPQWVCPHCDLQTLNAVNALDKRNGVSSGVELWV